MSRLLHRALECRAAGAVVVTSREGCLDATYDALLASLPGSPASR